MCDTKTPADEGRAEAFVTYLLGLTHRDGVRTQEYFEGALRGQVIRIHVDECHPGQVDEVRELELAQHFIEDDDRRAGFLEGYAFSPKEGS